MEVCGIAFLIIDSVMLLDALLERRSCEAKTLISCHEGMGTPLVRHLHANSSDKASSLVVCDLYIY